MRYTTNTYQSLQNETIYYYKWKAENDKPFRGIIQISHGVGEHARRYKSIAKKLQKQG